MTLAEFDEKIAELELVLNKANGLKKAELRDIIEDLETKRVSFLTKSINDTDFGFTQADIKELQVIAQKFQDGTEGIEESNELIDNAIRLGKKLLSLI